MRGWEEHDAEQRGVLGPGTDLVICLVAVLLLIVILNRVWLETPWKVLNTTLRHLEFSFNLCELNRAEQEIQGEESGGLGSHQLPDRETWQAALKSLRDRSSAGEIVALLGNLDDWIASCEDLLKEAREVQKEGIINIFEVQENQEKFKRSLEMEFRDHIKKFRTWENSIEYITDGGDIISQLRHDAHLQHVTFGGEILFGKNEYELDERGKVALTRFGNALSEHLANIEEVQIQGHADIDLPPGATWHYNLDLGAQRAMRVLEFLKDKQYVDPVLQLVSATSYGHYKPTNRSQPGMTYDMDQLQKANRSQSDKDSNRRIEVVLIFGRQTPSPSRSTKY